MAQKILLIEDDRPTRDFYHDLLTQEGYEVVTAEDGKRGLEKILEGGYNLILLDIIMPKLDGLGVLKALQKSKPKTPNGPIIVLTVVGQEHIKKDSLKFGAEACLIKTQINPEEILRYIKKYLDTDETPTI